MCSPLKESFSLVVFETLNALWKKKLILELDVNQLTVWFFVNTKYIFSFLRTGRTTKLKYIIIIYYKSKIPNPSSIVSYQTYNFHVCTTTFIQNNNKSFRLDGNEKKNWYVPVAWNRQERCQEKGKNVHLTKKNLCRNWGHILI